MTSNKVTLLNKLPRKDSLTGMDVWYKTLLTNIEYRMEKVSNVEGTNVSIGQTFMILLPFDELYKPYKEWVNNPDAGYTISEGDFIILNSEVSEIVTPNNIQSVRLKYEPNVCEVRAIIEVPNNGIARYRLRVEGV